jgi:AAA domain
MTLTPEQRAKFAAYDKETAEWYGTRGTPDGGLRESSPPEFVDWTEFWMKDRTAPEWLHEDVLAFGRGHAIYAKHGTGKSLFALWISLQVVKAGHVCIYADYEMGEDDLYERLLDMGFGPDDDLARLKYLQLPNFAPLDTAPGAAEFSRVVDLVAMEHPGRHIAVILDTIGRAVMGEENSNDTIMGFYRHTGLELKRRNVTWCRLDHAGHDGAHARGGSAKGDDVDIVWRLDQTDGGIALKNDKRRMGWVPQRVAFDLETEPLLRYIPVPGSWPLGTLETAQDLERLDVAIDAGTRTAQAALKDAGRGRRRDVVVAAQRWRQQRANLSILGREPLREPPKTGSAGTAEGTGGNHA